MPGIVKIVNRALSKLGDTPVTSLKDDAKTAQLADGMYELIRDGEIAAHSWNFAKSRDVLSTEMGAPAFGWKFQYQLPADCLRALEAGHWPQAVMSDYIGGETRTFVEEGGRILTNYGPTLNLIYLRREADPAFYPAAFIEVLACRLAVELCETVTGSNSKKEMAWREYQEMVKLAKRLNAIGRPPQAVADGSWVTGRLMGHM